MATPRATLARRATKNLHQLRDFAALIGFVAAGNGMRDAMRNMLAQDFLFRPPQRRAHGGDLRDDIDAVTVVFDHAGQATHLALDTVEPLKRRSLAFFCMTAIYPLGYDKAGRDA